MKTIFLRILESEDKASTLREAVHDPAAVRGRLWFEVDTESFGLVPGAPFAYWVRDKVRRLFIDHERLESSGRIARRTNGTTDDGRWIRAAWETPFHSMSDKWTWVPHVKGGAFSTFYSDVHLAIHWDPVNRTYPGYLGTDHRPDVRPASLQHFFRPGLTWPRRTNGLSFRVMPKNCIFGDKGPAVFVEGDASNDLLALCSMLNSAAYRALVALQLARTELAQSFEAGLIQQTPIPNLTESHRLDLSRWCHRAWALKRSLDAKVETSHAFTLPALLLVNDGLLAIRASAWNKHTSVLEAELSKIQADIDARCFELYGIDDADRMAIVDGFKDESEETQEAVIATTDEDLDENVDPEGSADTQNLVKDLVSWAAGCAFGRFDVRVATGERLPPDDIDPFAPLPVCSPAMLAGDDGLPLVRPPMAYPLTFPENGILTDDPGHERDLGNAVREVFDVVFKDSADVWSNEVASLLDSKNQSISGWLSAGFFEHHLKRHSKSRRKAPIIWQLAVPSGRYSIWLYAHRLSRDSLIQVQNDFVAPKLAHEERQLASLFQSAAGDPSAKDNKDIEAQEAFVGELRELLDEVKRVAPLWHPSLDDGIVLTMAPLWRLVPQHKAWQKEIKSRWEELVVGKYDWAHVAMHLWPERVVPKCAGDRSLAIAHGLEDVLWFEDGDGKWKPNKKPEKSVPDLVRERTSLAVKAALKSLLDAPEPASGAKRSRKSKAA